jgi:hypothetical protein
MRAATLLTVGCAALALASCARHKAPSLPSQPSGPPVNLVGRWQATRSDEGAIEFRADNTFTLTYQGRTRQGTYMLVNNQTEIHMFAANGEALRVWGIVGYSGDEMALADADGRQSPFRRAP